MRIAVIAPPWAPIPPPSYGGIEVVVNDLALGFQAAGHDVVLVATGDSTCRVPRRATLASAERARLGMVVPEMLHVTAAYDHLAGFDLVHDHTVAGPFCAERYPALTVVTTAHGPLDGELGQLYGYLEGAHLIAISQAQADSAPHLPVSRVIHHGVDLRSFPFGQGDGGYCMFLGRMAPEKGAHRAVAAAREAGMPLVLAAKCSEPAEQHYFREFVEPALGNGVRLVGEASTYQKRELLASARALLFPIRWCEPFGMVMIEALACGTPVLAFAEGSAPEIVEHGVNGYLCADEADMAEAIGAVDDLDRRACRASVERRFSAQRMVAQHLELFSALLDRGEAASRGLGAAEPSGVDASRHHAGFPT